MDVKLAAAVGGTVRAGEIAQFCRDQRITRQTFYKWRARFLAGGLDGLEERSRRPLSSATQTTSKIEELVVLIRKELDDFGSDNGPWSIRQQLLTRVDLGDRVPSEATIWRLLRRRGLVVAEPRKRPRSSWKRFVWERPNDLWQIDATHWTLADGTVVEIINIIDDHSRRLCPSTAVTVCTCAAAWAAFEQASELWGLPARMLSDNGLSFNGSHRNVTVEFETNLRVDRSATDCLDTIPPANVRQGRTVPRDIEEVVAQTVARCDPRGAATPTRRMGRALQPSSSPPVAERRSTRRDLGG